MIFRTGFILGTLLLVGLSQAQLAQGLPERFSQLDRNSEWNLVKSIPVNFATFHPQGMVKIGDTFFVSAVEIVTPTERYETPQGGYDRSVGEGVGHLFKFGADGNLIDQITLGEGSIYHPGGIDFDGENIWVPVAEYRPDSRSIVYRVDPDTLKATEVFRFADHLGGVVHNTERGALHGVSWGSRRFYRWGLDDALTVTNADATPESLRTLNQNHYLDYQDCHYGGGDMMLCSGLVNYVRDENITFAFGGLELVDLQTGLPVYQLPVTQWTESGLVMTQNPFFAELRGEGLRFYFMPEDDSSTVYVYDVTPSAR